MTSKTINRIRKIYAVAVTGSTILAGLCLMSACLSIYRSGDKPFSREAVAAAFSFIAVPVYLCLGIILIGFLLNLLLPKEATRRTAEKQQKQLLTRLRDRADWSAASNDVRIQIRSQQRLRRVLHSITGALLALGSLAFLAYIFSGDRFTLENINQCVIRAAAALLICTCVPLACGITCAYWCRSSMDREIALWKQLPKAVQAKKAPAKTTYPLLIPRLIFLTAGIALLIYGFFTGGTADVLVKAINICTECVGLG